MPIISLACIERLDLLERLFGRILIAEAVYREIKAKPGYGYAQIDRHFIDVRPFQGRRYLPLLLLISRLVPRGLEVDAFLCAFAGGSWVAWCPWEAGVGGRR